MDGVVSAQLKVLMLGKRDDFGCIRARDWCAARYDLRYFDGVWGDLLPAPARDWQGDLIISYLSRWVVPADLLARAKIAAINFHPGTPQYPGIGCNNFALYEQATSYGATCHHMAARVDTGGIIQVERFTVAADETVATLLARTYAAMEQLFYRVMNEFERGLDFAQSDEVWSRLPFTRAEFEALSRITPVMSEQEVARRVLATDYPPWGPTVALHGYIFKLDSTQKGRT